MEHARLLALAVYGDDAASATLRKRSATAVRALADETVAKHGGKRDLDRDLTSLLFSASTPYVHKADLPTLLALLHPAQVFTPAALTRAVFTAWQSPEFPERTLGADTWTALWRAVGYAVNAEPAQPPTAPITLYRGIGRGARRRHGLAWTADLDQAEWFARRFNEQAVLLTANVTPDRLLGRITARGENEYVIDTAALTATRTRL